MFPHQNSCESYMEHMVEAARRCQGGAQDNLEQSGEDFLSLQQKFSVTHGAYMVVAAATAKTVHRIISDDQGAAHLRVGFNIISIE